jgi:hypothetical protein
MTLPDHNRHAHREHNSPRSTGYGPRRGPPISKQRFTSHDTIRNQDSRHATGKSWLRACLEKFTSLTPFTQTRLDPGPQQKAVSIKRLILMDIMALLLRMPALRARGSRMCRNRSQRDRRQTTRTGIRCHQWRTFLRLSRPLLLFCGSSRDDCLICKMY